MLMEISIFRHDGTPPAVQHIPRRLHQSPPATRLRGRSGSQGILSAWLGPDDGKDSDRRAASRWGNQHQFPFPVSRKSQTGTDVFAYQVGKVFENVLFAHARGKVLQYIGHGHAEPANARLAAASLRINRNAVFPIHMVQSRLGIGKDQGCHQKSARASFPPLWQCLPLVCQRQDSYSPTIPFPCSLIALTTIARLC